MRLTVALRATIRILGSAAFIRDTTTSRVAPLLSLRKCTSSIIMRPRRTSPAVVFPRLVRDSHFSGCRQLVPCLVTYSSNDQSTLVDLLENGRGVGGISSHLNSHRSCGSVSSEMRIYMHSLLPDPSLSLRSLNLSFQSRQRSLQRAYVSARSACGYQTYLGGCEVDCIGSPAFIFQGRDFGV